MRATCLNCHCRCYRGFHASIEKDVYDALSLRGSLSARKVLGGTAPVQVQAQIVRHRARLG